MKKSTKLRLYGLTVLPALIISLIAIAVFEVNCEEQVALSVKLDNLMLPFVIVRGGNYCVAFFCIIALLCILSKKPQPVFAFGISIWIIFPCISSLLAALEINISYPRYEYHLKSFNVSTKYNRKLTHDLLTYLNEANLKCCGLTDFVDYFPDTTRYTVLDDTQDATNVEITMREYFNGSLSKKFEHSERVFEGDVPKSCCEPAKPECNIAGSVFTLGNSGNSAGIYPNGCFEALLKPFKKCETNFLLITISPFIILILTSVPTWCHLRQARGLSPCRLRAARVAPTGKPKSTDTDSVVNPAAALLGSRTTPQED